MGAFDDLIPAKSGGAFDDLIPKKSAGKPAPQTTSPAQAGVIDFMNQGSAASQGTTPMTQAHAKNLLSDQVYESDTGEVMFRDPASGKVVPTDKNKHVALRDPADNKVKVYSRTADTDEGRLTGLGRVMTQGMVSMAPTARPGLAASVARSGEPVAQAQPRASEILSTAKPYYKAFEQEARAVPIAPQVAASYGQRIRTALDNANLDEELAKPVYHALKRFDRGEPMALDELQKVKRVIGRSFASPDKNVRDGASVASREINRIISDASKEAGQALKTADEIHSTAKSVQELQRKEAVAGLRAGRAGYGGNSVNTMRQVLSPIVEKAVNGRVTGFKPNEIEAMRQIVEGTNTTNTLRLIGQVSPSKGIIQSGAAGGAAYAAGPVALAIPAVGMASNKLATVLTGKQIDHLKTLVAKRSPAYAAAVREATERYERAQTEFVTRPSAEAFGKYIFASRALSAGLTRDGIQVTSGSLMKSLQGPARSDEGDQKQD